MHSLVYLWCNFVCCLVSLFSLEWRELPLCEWNTKRTGISSAAVFQTSVLLLFSAVVSCCPLCMCCKYHNIGWNLLQIQVSAATIYISLHVCCWLQSLGARAAVEASSALWWCHTETADIVQGLLLIICGTMIKFCFGCLISLSAGQLNFFAIYLDLVW